MFSALASPRDFRLSLCLSKGVLEPKGFDKTVYIIPQLSNITSIEYLIQPSESSTISTPHS